MAPVEGCDHDQGHNFTDEADEKAQEEWALKLFTDHLLGTWFTPTLSPGQTKSTPVTTGGLPGAGTTGTPATGTPATGAPPTRPPAGHPDGAPASRHPRDPARDLPEASRDGDCTHTDPADPDSTDAADTADPAHDDGSPDPTGAADAADAADRHSRRQSSPRPRPTPPRCLPASRSVTSPRPAAPASRSR